MRNTHFIIYAVLVSMLLACTEKSHPETDEGTDETIPTDVFVKGADLSWVTEMEADGIRFRDSSGKEKD